MADALNPTIMATLAQTRKTSFTISYRGQDLTSQISESLLDLVYRESLRDNILTHSMVIKLADPESTFRQTFTINTYSTVDVTINSENFAGPGSGTLSKTLPTMWISGLEIEQDKHSGTTIRLVCSSTVPQSSFRLQKGSSSYGNSDTPTTLRAVAQDIATKNGMTLNYPSTVQNPTISRIDQHDESPARTLQKLCQDNDLFYVVHGLNITIGDMQVVESSPVKGTVVAPTRSAIGGLNNQSITRWSYRETLEDIYGSCAVTCTDPRTGNTVQAETQDPNQPASAPKLVHHRLMYSSGEEYDHITAESTTDQPSGTQSGN
jgi:phage protein D